MNTQFHDACTLATNQQSRHIRSYSLVNRLTLPPLFVPPQNPSEDLLSSKWRLTKVLHSFRPPRHKPPLTSLAPVEHNVPKPSTTEPAHPPRRPDLSTFFSTLQHVDTTDVSNGNALPVPGDVSAAFRTLAEAFERMRPDRSGEGPLDGMIELLVANSQAPPKEVKGVSQGFLDGE